ncbi:uncharacterized protein Bfra_003355, partial [Botrytis fragariae]
YSCNPFFLPTIEAGAIILTFNGSAFNVDESGERRKEKESTKKGMVTRLIRATIRTTMSNLQSSNEIEEGILTSEKDNRFEKVRLNTE